ncbi:MAG: flagellar basal body-associated protein FliL [Hyphomicrobiales bacterium]|nr:MAG: flagellar basal body-associated protein FliL [Hyphomicrobiales bacterium]
MKQTIIVGLWACAVTLGGAYGGATWRLRANNAPTPPHEEKLETHKVKPITVPIISEGALKGYIAAEFSMLSPKTDAHGGHEAGLDPEGYFMDEAFRLIYAESKIDFTQIQKTDLAVLTSRITTNVNKRLGRDVIKETLVKSFAFVPRDDLQQ